jgi:hypothetical protein
MEAMASDNLFDVVQELRDIVADLKRTLYGDHATRSTGLLTEFDGLRRDVESLKQDVQKVKNKKPSIPTWTAGFLVFWAGELAAIVALINLVPGFYLFGVSSTAAMWLAIVFGASALVLFIAGFGWLDRG